MKDVISRLDRIELRLVESAQAYIASGGTLVFGAWEQRDDMKRVCGRDILSAAMDHCGIRLRISAEERSAIEQGFDDFWPDQRREDGNRRVEPVNDAERPYFAIGRRLRRLFKPVDAHAVAA